MMTLKDYLIRLNRLRDPRIRGGVIGVCGGLIGIAAYMAGPGPAAADAAKSHNVIANSATPQPGDASDNSTVAGWLDSQNFTNSRNPFAVQLNAFPAAGNGQELGKSGAGAADQNKQRPDVLSELQRAAAGLRLQSVVMGITPTVVINGVSAKEGDVVASFRIARIDWNGVVVEKDGAQFDIALDETSSRRVD